MKKFESYSRVVPWFMALLMSVLVAGCGSSGQAPILGADGAAIAPVVTVVAPLPRAIDVPVNTKIITAAFTNAMDPATLTAASFTLACPVGTPVTGVVSYVAAGNVATLTLPTATNLPASIVCTATVTTAAKDAAGLALASDFAWTFTTGVAPDTTAPTVTGTINLNGATNVAFNSNVGATFSEVMDPLTMTSTNFTLRETVSGTAVTGVISYSSVNAVFNPVSALAPSTNYTVTVKGGASGVKDVRGNTMVSDFTISWTTGAAPDTTAPTVTGTIHTNGQTNVAFNTNVGATFSEGMNPLTITTLNFTLRETVSGTAVAGVVSYSGVSAVFNPVSDLAPSTNYTVTVKGGANGVKDLAGNAKVSDFTISWTTGAAPDTTAPFVIDTINANGAINVAVNTNVGATFSEGMNPLTITNVNFLLRETVSGTAVTGVVSYSGVNAVFNPVSNLAPSTNYTVTIKGGASGVKDLAGNAKVSDFVISWTTGLVPDTTAPTINVVNPSNLTPDWAINSPVNATFTEAMNPLTVTTASFTLMQGATPVLGTVTYSQPIHMAIFTPLSPLAYSTTYTALVSTGVTDLAGNALASGSLPNPWSFTTAAVPVTPPSPPPPSPPPGLVVVNLGRAVNFAVLAGTALSNTNPTTVTGDVGAASQSTNPTVTAGYVNYVNVGDQPLIDALADMPAALADANGRTCDVSDAGPLNSFSGQSFTPGVYCYGGAINVTGTLNLNGPGVYIFRTASTLDTVASAIVAFTGGATSANTSVFWVPAGATTIATLTTFKGTVLSAAAITVGSGATLQDGRVLSTAAVTLSNNVISRPFP